MGSRWHVIAHEISIHETFRFVADSTPPFGITEVLHHAAGVAGGA